MSHCEFFVNKKLSELALQISDLCQKAISPSSFILFSSKLPQISLATHQLAVESVLIDQIETRIPLFADGVGKIDAPHHKLGRSVWLTQRRQSQGPDSSVALGPGDFAQSLIFMELIIQRAKFLLVNRLQRLQKELGT